jgi:pyruvate-formate lyase-activating enzyme
MYVPAYSLPLVEIAAFVKSKLPKVDIRIISMPMDYGLPLSREGRDKIYQELLEDISEMKPRGIGISCTAVSQAEEVINLCNLIKIHDPDIFIFLGGYFPTLYYEEILARTSAVDLIVMGDGELPALRIIELLEDGENPRKEHIPRLVWKEDGQIRITNRGERFDLNMKACPDLSLLAHPRAYDIALYSFSRGCSFACNFCMESYIRPSRREVPANIVQRDLTALSRQSQARTLLISDALFQSFHLLPFLRSLDFQVIFETRCDVLTPSIFSEVTDVCAALAIGFESASYNTLRRMNKVRDRSHYERYMTSALAIFKEAARREIPVMFFVIAGYPGDTEDDLEETLRFARDISQHSGPGGHVFKIGECQVYPKTRLHDFARSLPDVVFDDDGVFGQNVVRQPSRNLKFETVLSYMKEIFGLSNQTPRLQETLLTLMPFFRLPVVALRDESIPARYYRSSDRDIFVVHGGNLSSVKSLIPELSQKYRHLMAEQRKTRNLNI